MIQRVTDAERVEVGRYYMVPCVRVNRSSLGGPGTGKRLGWLPVIGPAHEDKAILDFSRVHYHYDWRFIDAKQASVIGHDPTTGEALSAIETLVCVIEKQERKLRCRRAMPTFPLPPPQVFPLAKLESAYASHRIKPDCRVCPHRGVPLNGLPVRDGAVVCPGHGLKWNIATGGLVRRTSAVRP